jgi:hypothetical protein
VAQLVACYQLYLRITEQLRKDIQDMALKEERTLSSMTYKILKEWVKSYKESKNAR